MCAGGHGSHDLKILMQSGGIASLRAGRRKCRTNIHGCRWFTARRANVLYRLVHPLPISQRCVPRRILEANADVSAPFDRRLDQRPYIHPEARNHPWRAWLDTAEQPQMRVQVRRFGPLTPFRRSQRNNMRNLTERLLLLLRS